MPDHSRPENIPPVMPQKHYDTLGKAARGPNPPIAWKLNAERLTHISKSKRPTFRAFWLFIIFSCL